MARVDMLSEYLDYIQQIFYPVAKKGIIVMSSIPSMHAAHDRKQILIFVTLPAGASA